MAGTMYDTKVAKQTRKQPSTMVGYYTQKEAAKVLGVVEGTMKYRRDHAVAGAKWEELGLKDNDPAYALLNQSHTIRNEKHYYLRSKFDQFAALYKKRPEVVRARRQRTKFVGTHTIRSVTVRTQAECDDFTKFIQALLKVDGAVHITIHEL